MVDSLAKHVLYIDLSRKEFGLKHETGLKKYLGGVGTGLRLLADNLERYPVVFSVGPLNGFFPFCSKTSVVLDDNGVIEDIYIGGSLSSRIRFAGLDNIVFLGKSKTPVTVEIHNEQVIFRDINIDLGSLGLPGKRSVLYFNKERELFTVDRYFSPPERILENKLLSKNLVNIVITGSKTYEIKDPEKYEELYKKVLAQTNQMTVEKGSNPSCVGCPMGCSKSKIGEIGGNILTHSLVACQYAEKIFSDVGVTFSCLNILGYDYTHEDIENTTKLIELTMKELEQDPQRL